MFLKQGKEKRKLALKTVKDKNKKIVLIIVKTEATGGDGGWVNMKEGGCGHHQPTGSWRRGNE